MDTVYDAKGKYFTEIVTKGTVQVIIQTTVNRIEGCIHIRPDDRVIDALNTSDNFLALTDVVVYNLEDKTQYQSDFLTINKDHIQWVLPIEDTDENTPTHESN